MRVLLFTHEQDIDGIGSIILLKQTSIEFDYITSSTFQINDKVENTIKDKSIYNYDFIYVTDICIREPLLLEISEDKKLKDKILILDHHKAAIENGDDKYPFICVTVENKKGKTSGTSLFYEHLIKNKLIKRNKCLDEFVELTRQYDTWEWIRIYNNEKARKLHILFEQLGYKEYIREIEKNIKEKLFNFSSYQLELIDDFEKKLEKSVNEILKSMKIYYLEIDGNIFKLGFVSSPYQYRNDLSEAVVRDNNNDIDILVMPITDEDTVSYRSIKDVDCSKVASYFGGSGHKTASSSLKSDNKFINIINILE